ncbi:ROK family protein [Brachybacterium paraconglomeratum]|uniref:ROK family protein n=1 Tax=Brachybacterium paraconglomeratum TaxID=173362 RepID=UPI0021A5906D|nr:ROK family protein [Brachybacterium paraconglomeratum]MCT1910145.1 ROK family protein [Brachybacterium paraconglomeratum]
MRSVDRGVSSPQLMRRANRQALLQHALGAEAFTAADAMAATGLTRATVLGVCAELEQAGWLEEAPAERDGAAPRGRPARRFSLRAQAGILLAVDAGQHTLAAHAADLRGRELAAERLVLEDAPLVGEDLEAGAAAAERRLEALRALLDRVSARAGARGPVDAARAEGSHDAAGAVDAPAAADGRGTAGAPRLLTVVGVPAPVDAEGRSPSGDAGYWPAMNPGLVDALDGPVLVENDANLAALAERAHLACSGADADHLAALLMGERFGAGLVVDGRLLRGADGGAGEMRFLETVLGDPRGADGVAALARRWALEALEAGETSAALSALPAAELGAKDVFAAARDGDALAGAVLERIGDRLARIAMILSSLIAVDTVVVAGAIAEAIDPVLEHAREALPRIGTPPLPQLRASSLGRDVVVRGALELALTRLREDPLALLATDPVQDPHPPTEGNRTS